MVSAAGSDSGSANLPKLNNVIVSREPLPGPRQLSRVSQWQMNPSGTHLHSHVESGDVRKTRAWERVGYYKEANYVAGLSHCTARSQTLALVDFILWCCHDDDMRIFSKMPSSGFRRLSGTLCSSNSDSKSHKCTAVEV